MFLQKIKPTTPGQRWRVAVKGAGLSRKKPEKKLVFGKSSKGGRNSLGRITAPHKGGRHKRKIRYIDIYRDKKDVIGVVKSIEYNPFGSAYIALIYYVDGVKSYIIAPSELKVGDKVVASDNAPIKPGNALPLSKIPDGAFIHNIELNPNSGARFVRSAGVFAQIVSKVDKYVIVKLPSGEQRKILSACIATIGKVSNGLHKDQKVGKAGRNRWLGIRPRVRAVAMNPVDHPMGGGEGKASGGHPRSRNGIYAKGQKTRNKKKHSSKYIIFRSKK